MIRVGRIAAILILAVSLPVQWLIYVLIWALAAEPPQIWFESILWIGLPTILLVGLATLPGGWIQSVRWLGYSAALHLLLYGLTWVFWCVPPLRPYHEGLVGWIMAHPDPSGAVLTLAGAGLLAGMVWWSWKMRRANHP